MHNAGDCHAGGREFESRRPRSDKTLQHKMLQGFFDLKEIII